MGQSEPTTFDKYKCQNENNKYKRQVIVDKILHRKIMM